MRNWIAIPLVLVLLLSLSGCSSAAATLAAEATNSTTPNATTGGRPGGEVMGLVMGTLQLDGTDLAVDAAQAGELLPLWKAYRALLNSDATAPEELTALVEQIREGMTAEQLSALDGATLDPEAQSALAARFGIEMPTYGGGVAIGDLTEAELATRTAERTARLAEAAAGGDAGPGAGGGVITQRGDGSGRAFGGFAQGGGGFQPPEGFVPPDGVQAAAGGGASVRAGSNAWVSSLVDALITYLEGLH